MTLQAAAGRAGDSAPVNLPGAAGMLASESMTAAGSNSVAPISVLAEPVDEASYLFDQNELRTYNLVIAPNDLALIDQNPMAEMYVAAGLEFEGKSYGPYSARYKGSAGAWLSPCTLLGDPVMASPKFGKCSIKLAFDQTDSKARFYGLKKLNFHSMNADPSMLRERLSYNLFRDMGISAPRAVHARLLINGKLEGLFALVEQIDGRFTRARFGDGGEGNLYKEVWPTYADPSVYIAALESNTKQPNVQRMLDFQAAVSAGPNDFAGFIDRDYILRYMAVDRLIINDDGIFHFWCTPIAQGNNPGEFGNHNYYWYEATSQSRFWLIPWDLDFAFEARTDCVVFPAWTEIAPCTCAHKEYGLQRPASCDPVVAHLATWQADYNRKVDDFIAGPFAADRVNDKLDRWIAQIQPVVGEAAFVNAAPSLNEWKAAVTKLRGTIESARDHRGYVYP